MAAFRRLAAGAMVAAAAGSTVPIATFDGAVETTRSWEPVNDPVMGGKSKSTFHVDEASKVGVWDGAVVDVPFLHAPGFCNLMSPGLYKTEQFPDLTGAEGLVARLSAREGGLTHFRLMLATEGLQKKYARGTYAVNLTVTSQMEEHFVSFSSFVCTKEGSIVDDCPDLASQLNQASSIGFGTAFPGAAGAFHVEIESLRAAPAPAPASAIAATAVDLATFDGKAPHTWHSENDPVMGGQSSSSFSVSGGIGTYSGTCRIVPSLKAPGFTIAMTETPLVGSFPDVSAMEGLVLGVRNAGGNVTTFKVAFCDSRINYYRCQFGSFKADFAVTPSSGFQEIFVPWSTFSDKWSPSTGRHTAEEPPATGSLKSITQLQIWTEGVLGDFKLEIKYVRAGKTPSSIQTFLV